MISHNISINKDINEHKKVKDSKGCLQTKKKIHEKETIATKVIHIIIDREDQNY